MEEKATTTKPNPLKKNISININIFRHISVQEKVDFARHLSITIKSSVPLVTGLRLIKEQTSSKYFASIIGKIINKINSGQSLASALQEFSHIFGDFFISIVGVGEASGNLSTSLLYVSSELKKQRELNNKIKSALIYPTVVFFATIGMTIFLTTYIFPKIIPIFSSLNVKLPFTTKLVIAFFEFITTYYPHVGIGLVVLVLGGKLLLSVKSVHILFDRVVLKIPVLSQLIINATVTNFSRSLGILLKSGMTIIDALEVSKETFHNMYYQYHIEKMVQDVRRGESIGKYLGEHRKLFPPMLVGMIKVGESTGNLEENLVYIAEYYTEELDLSIKNLTSLLEPFLVLIMGIVVGFIALSIITPIYSVTQGLNVSN